MAEGRSITGTHEVGRATYIGAALEVDPEGNHETVTGPGIPPGQVPEIPGLNPELRPHPVDERQLSLVEIKIRIDRRIACEETSWPFKRL